MGIERTLHDGSKLRLVGRKEAFESAVQPLVTLIEDVRHHKLGLFYLKIQSYLDVALKKSSKMPELLPSPQYQEALMRSIHVGAANSP